MTMTYLLLIFIIIDVAQTLYIKWLKKEICLRDGTYKPKANRFLKWFKKKKDDN